MTRFFVRFPVTTWMIFVAFVVLGAYSIPRLKIEAVPDVNLPTLTVNTSWNGASPQAVQRAISIPIEEAVQDVHGVEKLESTSRAGNSTVTISFRRDTNIDFARLELNEQLGDVRRNLPLGAMQPQIVPFVPEEFRTEDFFTFSLESPLSPNELRELAETWVIPQVIAVPGVADAEVLGGARPLVKIVLDRRLLELYRIRADEVFRAIDRLDEFEGAGVVRDRGLERLVALRRPVSMATLRNAPVARSGGQTFTLSMVGEVRADFEDPAYFVRANGKNVVQVSIDKRSGANTVGVSRDIRKALPGIRADVPAQVDFHIDEDQGKDLEDKLRDLIYRSFAILAILFIMLAISVRQLQLTAIVTASIIFATLISLSMFYFLRISVNFITISGLAVCFGMIVDNSILVLDAIHRRLEALTRAEELDMSRRAKLEVAYHAILDGSRDILQPAMATTLTTVVVFASFVFLSGRLALYYVPLAVSVTTALAASLFVAFGWVPMVLHRLWARPMVAKLADGSRDVVDPAELDKLVAEPPASEDAVRRVDRMFAFFQRGWWLIVPLSLAIFAGSWWVYQNKVNKGGFWKFPSEEELFLYLEMPSGTDLDLTSETLRTFEEQLTPVPEGVRMSSRAFGNQAIIRIEFDKELRETPLPFHWRELLIAKADVTGGSSVFIRGFSDRPYFKGAFGGSALNSLVKITGYNSKRLNEIAETTLERIEKNRRVRNARITTGAQFERVRQEEMVIRIRRERLAAHDLTVTDLTAQIRRMLGVDIPWTMLIDEDQERVQLSFSDAENVSYADIAELVVRGPDGEQVRLKDLIEIERREVSRSITRENQKYTTHVNWEYLGTDQMRQRYIKEVLAGIDVPYGYRVEEARQEFLTQEEEEEIGLAIWLAVAFIFIVLAALTESVSIPVIILMSIPMSLVGVVAAFWVTHSVFDSSARIGLVLLFGVAVNNAILLVSRYRTEATLTLRACRGGDPELEASLFPSMRKSLGGSDLWVLPAGERVGHLVRAVARGTRVRMRSILLTSGTTIVGLAPLLVHMNDTADKDIWENLALATIGGLTSSTLLMLFMIPALYTTSIRVGWVLRRLRGWLGARLRRRPPAAATSASPSI
ncbi:MAG TPA: efflux RND transporter permease subunit [Candidatus Krumholzibacteria bacterium]|nr:efflux RND transporter permease subunit [Candidatus Krumholzibacteria bacterium]